MGKPQYWLWLGLTLVMVLVSVAACGGTLNSNNQNNAQRQAQTIAQNRQYYVPKNDVEGKNYDKRLQIADDPATILWCSTYWGLPGSPLITVPIVGKLTSGAKRPFPDEQINNYDTAQYNPEIPGADGMYGSSGDYRYGFTPDGTYVDFYGMAVFCSTTPSVYQLQSTTVVSNVDQGMLDAQKKAQDLIRQGKPDEAAKVLQAAIDQYGKH